MPPSIAEDDLRTGIALVIVQLMELLQKLYLISFVILFGDLVQSVIGWDVTPQ